MSIRNRTTKLIARRHDLNYFKRQSPIRAWQWYLAGGALVCAIAWFAGTTIARGDTDFSSGPISSSHAVFGQRCELCHVPVIKATGFTPAFGRRNHVPDSACLSCHTAPAHFPMESKENPTCGSCHNEHIGATHLANTADSTCTQCHANLETRSGTLKVASHVDSFAREHPDFRPLRLASYQERAAAFALRFNHAEHMKPGLTGGPNGPENLTCQSCHVTSVNAEGKQSYGMAPVSFEKSCQSCHGLEFDTHIKQQAPHADPAIVRAFVTQQITGFAQAHPDVVAAEIRNWPTEAPLPSKMPMAPPHTPAEWIANRTARAEIILYREKCELCHKDLNRDSPTEPTFLKASFQTELTPSPASDMPSPMQSSPMQSTSGMSPSAMLNSIQLPRIENAHQPERWYKGAIFSHPAHQAEECVDCHAAALTSVNGTDLLMPSISTCRRCHNGESSPQGPPVKVGHAESGCFLCHVYHGPHGPDLTSNHTLAQLLSSH